MLKPIIIIESATTNTVLSNKTLRTDKAYNLELFIRHFIEYFNFYDSFDFKHNIPKALEMMHPSLADYYKNDVLTSSFKKQIESLDTYTITNIKKVSHKEESGKIKCTISYSRKMIEVKNNRNHYQLFFIAEIIIEELKKGRSKEFPYGLKIIDFSLEKVL